MGRPDGDDLADQIGGLLDRARPCATVAYRMTGVAYANGSDMLAGRGAAEYGGRWNPVGLLAVYASLDLHTAVEEATANAERAGLAPGRVRPMVLVSIEARLERVLDLNEPEVQDRLGVSSGRMAAEPWQAIQRAGGEAITQAIGRLAHAAGFSGLLAPTRLQPPWNRGINLVAFPDLIPPDALRVVGAESLPPGRLARVRGDFS